MGDITVSDFVIDWGLVGSDGQTTTLQDGSTSLDVTVSTPSNSEHRDFDTKQLDGRTVLEARCVEEPVKTIVTFGDPVSNVSFTLLDVDQGNGWDDKVTIIARDAQGNIVPVTFGGLTHHDTDGNTVEGGGTSRADTSFTSSDNVNVSIAGPIASLEIVLDNGATDDESGTVAIGPISFDAAPIGDGYVNGSNADDTIGSGFVDPDGDRVDANDQLVPGEGQNDDIILAEGGDDTVFAGAGDDEVFAGNGDDVVYGQDGNDYLNGGKGHDMLFGGAGDDGIVGGKGNDKVEGSQGADAIAGGDGHDDLWGGKDNDVISGGRGNDDIDAGDGDDLVFGGQGADTITGGAGDDTISGGSQNINENIDFNDLAAGDLVTTQFVDKGFTVTSSDPANPVMVFDSANPTGGDSDLGTSNLGNVLILSEDRDPDDPDDNAGGGAFVFDFENPANIVNLGLLDIENGATITLKFADGSSQDVNVAAVADNGQTTEWLNADNVIQMTVAIPGSGAIDNLCFSMDPDAGDGNDVIDAGDGDDTVFGNAGDDTITGGAGADTLVGGDDADTIFGGAGDTVDGSEGGDDNDTLDLSGQGPIRVIYDPTNDENGVVEFLDGSGDPTGSLSFTNIENVVGDIVPEGDGIVEGDDNANTIDAGFAGDPNGDFVDANDALLPGEGPQDDIIIAGGGDDNVFAGEGDDDVLGGAGDDTLRGETGDDYLDGNDGDDTLRGGQGDDRLSGGDGNDDLSGGGGQDAITGGDGDDTIDAGGSADIVDAGDGDDVIDAGEGDDVVYGGAGSDEIEGGDGDDILLGGGAGTPGDNLIFNGSFEDTTGMTTTGYGFVGTGSVPNWTETQNPNNEIDFHNDGRGGVNPTDGQNWLDLEASPGGTRVGQAVAGITTGELYTLTFDAGDAPGENNVVNVYWGGALVGTLSPEDSQMDEYEFVLEGGAGDGSNLLEFEGVTTSGAGNIGASIDNVVLVASGDVTDTSGDFIFGGTGDDLVDGQGGDDVLFGDEGDDTVIGGDGDDQVFGDEGDDTVSGGDGADLIVGGAGNDVLDGGDGDDDIFVGGMDVASGGDGDDVFALDPTDPGASVNITIDGGSDGTDGAPADDANGDEGDVLDLSDATQDLDVTFEPNPEEGEVNGLDADADSDITFEEIEKVITGSGDDTVDGADATGPIDIDTGSGDDTIETGSGDDSIVAGEGTDAIEGGAGDDSIDLGTNPDGTPDGDADTVVFSDGDGNDILVNFDTPITNPDGSLTGVEQLDVSNLTDADGNPVTTEDVTVAGNPDGDAVLTFPNGETITLGGVTPQQVDDIDELVAIGIPDGRDGIVQGTNAGELIDTNYLGDPNGDLVDAGDALLPGEVGDDDIIQAGGGDDTVIAGAGDDEVFGGTGNDRIEGNTGDDQLFGEDGEDRIIGGLGDDTIEGGDGNDDLSGNVGNDTIDGGDGDDEIGGAEGDDTLLGGAGEDDITGGSGDDTIDGGDDDDTIDAGSGDDVIAGGDGDDNIIGGDGSDTVTGGDGDDVINTSGHLPLLDLGFPGYPSTGVPPIPADFAPGNDIDFVDGGDGNDIIITGDDADTILGGDGNDTIDAGIDADTIDGGDGDDRIVGGEGSDVIDGGDGDDTIFAGIDPALGLPDDLDIPDDGVNQPADPEQNNGQDVVNGGAGNDTIFGQDDDDTLFGDEGDDFIDGGIDEDTISGGEGDDTIIGGEGADTLTGNSGEDTFLVNGVDEGNGDVIDGGQAASGPDDEIDTLDLTGSGNIKITYTSPDQEDGFVEFRDANDVTTGTLTFTEIENVIPCFTPGTTIATPKGERLVEELKVGDKIITRDNGLQEIRWLGAKTMDWKALSGNPHLKPVLVRAGALGNGLPERDMLVSPNHRVLVSNDKTALYFEEREVLAAAKQLVNHQGIHEVDTMGTVYIHFMFDQHEVVLSNGSWTESFQPGDYTLKGIGNAQRNEIFELFPELKSAEGIEDYRAARKTLKKHEAKLLLG